MSSSNPQHQPSRTARTTQPSVAAGSTVSQPSGSRTLTLNHAPPTNRQPVLHLRGVEVQRERTGQRPGIRWAEDVVDNEGMGRKKSKVCCIYHAPRNIDSSSDESSSDSNDSDSDSNDNGAARMSSNSKRNDCDGEHDGHTHNHDHGSRTGKRKVRGNRASSPNAYEKMPKVKGGGSGSGSATMLEKS